MSMEYKATHTVIIRHFITLNREELSVADLIMVKCYGAMFLVGKKSILFARLCVKHMRTIFRLTLSGIYDKS